jgi:hypothetical protein
MHVPRSSHLEVINRILRYLNSTSGKSIYMKRIFLTIYMAIPLQIGSEIVMENQQPVFKHL